MHLVDSLIHSFLNLLLVRSQRRTGGENTESTKRLRLCLYKPHRVVRNVSVILLLPPHWNLLYKMLYKRCNMLMKGTPFGSIHHLDEEWKLYQYGKWWWRRWGMFVCSWVWNDEHIMLFCWRKIKVTSFVVRRLLLLKIWDFTKERAWLKNKQTTLYQNPTNPLKTELLELFLSVLLSTDLK